MSETFFNEVYRHQGCPDCLLLDTDEHVRGQTIFPFLVAGDQIYHIPSRQRVEVEVPQEKAVLVASLLCRLEEQPPLLHKSARLAELVVKEDWKQLLEFLQCHGAAVNHVYVGEFRSVLEAVRFTDEIENVFGYESVHNVDTSVYLNGRFPTVDRAYKFARSLRENYLLTNTPNC